MRLWLAVLAAWALCPSARAHDPQLSGIKVLVGGGRTVVSVTTHRSQLESAGGLSGKEPPAARDLAIRQRLKLKLDGELFDPKTSRVLPDDEADLLVWQATLDREASGPEVLARLYPEDPSSRTVVSLVKDGLVVREDLLDAAHPSVSSAPSAPPESRWFVAGRFLKEGVAHIFGGPDHICFVLGLLLLGGTLKGLLKTVTAFTLAHSVTLTVAATGTFVPSPRLVEPIIALSIVAIAAENLRPHLEGERFDDLRPWLALGFGIIHGFGFAGALAEVGLPKESLGIALASFNGGVELGQASIVLAVVPGLGWLAKTYPKIHQKIVLFGSVAIGLAGVFWFVQRLSHP